MAEKTLEERLSELYEKIDHRDQFFDKDLKTLIDGIRDAREHGGTASVDVTPIVGGYKIVITDSEGVEHVATVKDGGDAYEVYRSTVPEGQSPMTKEEWLETLKGADGADGQDGAPGHNPCLGRFPAVPNPMPNGQIGDYLYVDITTVDPNTQEETTTTTVYHYGSNGWDNGAAIDAEHPTLASGQNVTAVHIKDENGEEIQGTADVLSAEAGAKLYQDAKKIQKKVDGTVVDLDISVSLSGSTTQKNDTNVFSLETGKKYKMVCTLNTTPSGNFYARFADSNNAALSNPSITISANETTKEVSFTATANHTNIHLNFYCGSTVNVTVSVQIILLENILNDIAGLGSTIDTKVDTLSDYLDVTENIVGRPTTTYDHTILSIEKYYVGSDGSIKGPSNNYKLAKIRIFEGQVVSVTVGGNTSTSAAIMVVHTKDGTPIQDSIKGASVFSTETTFTYTCPSNGYWLYISAHSSYQSSVSVAISGVGLAGNVDTNSAIKVKEWLLGEAFLINTCSRDSNQNISSASITWPDNTSGSITVTRNALGSATQVDYVYNSITYRLTITRDTNDNVNSMTIINL